MTNETLIGKTVEWTSQSAGYTKTKTGVVIADEPQGRRHVVELLPLECREAARSRVKFYRDEGWTSGVIVRVSPGPGRLPIYYAPVRSLLKVVSE